MTKKRHFSQEEKHTILMSAEEIGVEKAAEIAGIHYTTVHGWRGDLEAMGVDAFLAYKPSRPGRGVKHITEKQEKEILDVWEKNPGYGPGQVRNQLRRQGITTSIVTVRKILESKNMCNKNMGDVLQIISYSHKNMGDVLQIISYSQPASVSTLFLYNFSSSIHCCTYCWL